MLDLRPTFAAALSALALCAAEAQTLEIFPFKDPLQAPGFRPSDNGSDVKSFACKVEDGAIKIDFKDKPKQDNYLFIDLGHFDLASFWPGGYISADIEVDNPILKATVSLADPDNFWPTRISLEGEGFLRPGRNECRFYLDGILESRSKSSKDRLYLFLHDSGKDASDEAKAVIRKVSLHPQTAKWQEEKSAQYDIQYKHAKLRDLGPLYRASYERLIPWDSVENGPFVRIASLDGKWKKSFLGDLTWNYEALKDSSWAAPSFDDSNWSSVELPEPRVEDQKGGHYVYRKKFAVDAKEGKRIYLRIDDLADYAEIYVNGKKASSQTSTRRRHDWIVEGGSRAAGNAGKSIKEMLAWRNFDRCGNPCPFEKSAIPDGEGSLLLPIYTGENPWPMATDISDLLVDGENTLAIRLYGCPVKGFWIFRDSAEDRTFRNVFGILGSTKIAVDARPAIASFKKSLPGQVAPDGMASHQFGCEIDPKLAAEVQGVTLSSEGMAPCKMEKSGNGRWTASMSFPSGFGTRSVRASAMDKLGRALDERSVSFPECVVGVQGRLLTVNGDPFFVRGINAAPGIEWDNNRIATRREWQRELRGLRHMGFNSIRSEGASKIELEDALAEGFMIMPVYAPGSCDQSMIVLGNLEKPDYEFNTDGHKEMSLLLSSMSNILFWNTGNEIHHTAGWSDKALIDKFLETARDSVRRFDPCGRPAVYANLDTFNQSWFFKGGQDVIGLNTYSDNKRFAGEAEEFARSFDRPYVFTEWGFWDNEAKAVKDRSANVADWELRMAAKWKMIKETPGSAGGYLYAYHGELKDERGKAFLQKLMSPFEIEASSKAVSVKNVDVCPFRKLSAIVVSEFDAAAAEFSPELKPGESIQIKLPKGMKPGNCRLELKYETHRGLLQTHARELAIKPAK